MLKVPKILEMSVEEPTMIYYSLFRQLFKFIPRYRFEKKAEETSGNRYCKLFSAWRQFSVCLRPDGNPSARQDKQPQASRLDPPPDKWSFSAISYAEFFTGQQCALIN